MCESTWNACVAVINIDNCLINRSTFHEICGKRMESELTVSVFRSIDALYWNPRAFVEPSKHAFFAATMARRNTDEIHWPFTHFVYVVPFKSLYQIWFDIFYGLIEQHTFRTWLVFLKSEVVLRMLKTSWVMKKYNKIKKTDISWSWNSRRNNALRCLVYISDFVPIPLLESPSRQSDWESFGIDLEWHSYLKVMAPQWVLPLHTSFTDFHSLKFAILKNLRHSSLPF